MQTTVDRVFHKTPSKNMSYTVLNVIIQMRKQTLTFRTKCNFEIA